MNLCEDGALDRYEKLELYNNTDLQYSPDPPSPVFSSECSSSSGSESNELEPGSEDNTDCSESMEDLSAIYPGSSITIENFDALLLAFSQKHYLPKAAIDDLLNFFKLTLPESNNVTPSSYKLNKKMQSVPFCTNTSKLVQIVIRQLKKNFYDKISTTKVMVKKLLDSLFLLSNLKFKD